MSYATARTVDFREIPVVDLGPAFTDGAGLAATAAAVRRAAMEVGFLYVTNHGIAAATIDDAFAVAHRFFALPEQEKQAVAVDARHRGFIGIGGAKMYDGARPDLKESFVYGVDLPETDPDVAAGKKLMGPNRWPAALPEMKPAIDRYYAGIDRAGQALLRAVALSLDLPERFFADRYTKPLARGSLIYYPPQPPELGAEQFGVSAHTDYGCITFVCQDDNGGLQVRNRAGEWIAAPPIRGTLVVNIGDLLARWTNDRFRSTPHRVVNTSGRARYSMAVFYDPDYDAEVKAIPSCVAPGEAPHYPPTTCGAHVLSRFEAAFAYRRKEAATA
ncbi:MAG: isopenicillin N synthase family oxygenase [Rhodospirillaceae bacterium]|nr:isopenicillin N synthase family oxygenase [Rhodospirillaceae bacterium]